MVSGNESTFLGMKSTLSDGNLNKMSYTEIGLLIKRTKSINY